VPNKSKHPTKDYVPVAVSPDQRYLTVKNAASYLGATVSFVRHELVYAKGCPYVRLGARIVFDRADLDNFMARQKEAA
jgi:excisionase family DNA binding protein